MAEFREELDSLHAFIVSVPGVQPLFWQVALMLFGTQIRRRIDEGLIATTELVLSTVVDSCGPVGLTLLRVAFLGILQSLLTFFLIFFHQVLLILRQIGLLRFKLTHSLIESPRPLKITRAGLAKLLSL